MYFLQWRVSPSDSLDYTRKGNQEIFNICCDRLEEKLIKIPMRSAEIETILLDGEPISYQIEAAPNNSFILIRINKAGRFQLRVMHGNTPVPSLEFPVNIIAENKISFEVLNGNLVEAFDVSETLDDIKIVGNKVYAKAKAVSGDHTLFIRVQSGEYDAWLAADYNIVKEDKEEKPIVDRPFEPVDISSFFNCNMKDVHEQAYVSPRPTAFSMGVFQNGRFSHNWNQRGRYEAYIDDTLFRESGGIVHSPSGIPFMTPAENENLACVSVFDVFPNDITVPLSGKGQEIAVLFIASTYCMHSYVENARITVSYADGTSSHSKLIYPLNIDDWLTSALTTEAEIFYFNNYNHATVHKLTIDPDKELESIKIEAIANEVILGIAGISIRK